jgi:hypothetical protein
MDNKIGTTITYTSSAVVHNALIILQIYHMASADFRIMFLWINSKALS